MLTWKHRIKEARYMYHIFHALDVFSHFFYNKKQCKVAGLQLLGNARMSIKFILSVKELRRFLPEPEQIPRLLDKLFRMHPTFIHRLSK